MFRAELPSSKNNLHQPDIYQSFPRNKSYIEAGICVHMEAERLVFLNSKYQNLEYKIQIASVGTIDRVILMADPMGNVNNIYIVLFGLNDKNKYVLERNLLQVIDLGEESESVIAVNPCNSVIQFNLPEFLKDEPNVSFMQVFAGVKLREIENGDCLDLFIVQCWYKLLIISIDAIVKVKSFEIKIPFSKIIEASFHGRIFWIVTLYRGTYSLTLGNFDHNLSK